MTIKRYLNQVRHIDAELRSLERLREDLYQSLLKSPSTESERVTGGPERHGDDRFARIAEMSADINRKWDELVAKKQEIEQVIDTLEDPQERALVRNRYINLMSWNKIAKDMYLSERAIYYIHKRALKNIAVLCSN